MSEFKLYPEEKHWWSFSDHRAVMDTMRQLQPKRVLEFGPGSSTLALIEGWAESIDCLEDDPKWLGVYRDRLERTYPDVVRMHAFTWSDPLEIPALADHRWDLALIDGPLRTPMRPPVIAWCLARCTAVLVPTEDYHCTPMLRPFLEEIAAQGAWQVAYRETGPHSGGFALLTAKPAAEAEVTPAPKAEPKPKAAKPKADTKAARKK